MIETLRRYTCDLCKAVEINEDEQRGWRVVRVVAPATNDPVCYKLVCIECYEKLEVLLCG
jgi:hypothetical protein